MLTSAAWVSARSCSASVTARRPAAAVGAATATAAASPLRQWAGSASVPRQLAVRRRLHIRCQAETVQQEGAPLAAAVPDRRRRPNHGPCANPACGAVTAKQWHRADAPRLAHLGLDGSVCRRCYNYHALYKRLPDFPRGAGAKPGKPAASGKLQGPCANPACGADETNGQPWYSAANPRVKHLGLQGAICRRCHSFATRTGRLPHFAAGQRPKMQGPCSNPACHTSKGRWVAAPAGSGVEGAVCPRCFKQYTVRGSWPDTPPRRIAPPGSMQGPCANPACGTAEAKRWDAAPEASGLEGAVCHRCRVYFDLYGRLPAAPKKPHAPRGSRRGPCANPACGAETTHQWQSAPAGSGLEGDICSRCYASFRNKGTLPTKPNSRLRGVLARLQQQAAQGSKQGGKQGGS